MREQIRCLGSVDEDDDVDLVGDDALPFRYDGVVLLRDIVVGAARRALGIQRDQWLAALLANLRLEVLEQLQVAHSSIDEDDVALLHAHCANNI